MASQKEVKLVISAVDNASKTIKTFGQNMGGVLKVAAGGVAAFGAAAVAGGVAATAFASDSAKKMEVAGFFTEKFGDRSTGSLNALREASKNTITDIDLMATANRASLLGVTDNLDEMAGLMNTARLRGKAMGLDTTTAFNDIVTGIGRGSPLILDNLGIKIPDALKESMKGMTDAEKTQTLMNFAIQDGSELAKNMGGDVETAADKFAQWDVKIKNLKQELGEKLIPIVLKFIDTMMDLGTRVFNTVNKALEDSGLKDTFLDVFNSAKEVAGIFFDQFTKSDETKGAIKDGIMTPLEEVLAGLKKVMDQAKILFDFLKENPEIIQQAVSNIIKAFKFFSGVLRFVIGLSMKFAERLWMIINIITRVSTAFIRFKNKVGDALRGVWNIAKNQIVKIRDGFAKLPEKIGTFFNNLPAKIKGPLNKAIALVERAINKIIQGYNNNPLTPKVNTISIPRLARGTDSFRGGMALVGENGPERVFLPRGTAVQDARTTAKGMGGTTNFNVNIPMFMGDANSKKRVAEEIWKELDKIARAKGVDLNNLNLK
jgi:phage-related protein